MVCLGLRFLGPENRQLDNRVLADFCLLPRILCCQSFICAGLFISAKACDLYRCTCCILFLVAIVNKARTCLMPTKGNVMLNMSAKYEVVEYEEVEYEVMLNMKLGRVGEHFTR